MTQPMPDAVEQAMKRARRLAWITVVYLVSSVVVLMLVMGRSQAMKTEWIDDMLSVVPPISFLISSHVARRDANAKFPYGYLRATSVAFLAGSVALAGVGVILFVDASSKLLTREHPTVAGMDLFGHHVWMGWPMLVALAWSSIPAAFLGRAKKKLAKRLHDKGLQADSDMNKADWITAACAAAGVVGIGFGWWWADAVAAGLISLDVLYDGGHNVLRAVNDLMNRVPRDVEGNDDPVVERMNDELARIDWVRGFSVRMRGEGQRLCGEVFVVLADSADVLRRVQQIKERLLGLDWRVHDVVVEPVATL